MFDHSGVAFIVIGNNIIELWEFIKECRNIHYKIKILMKGIRMGYRKVQDERTVKASSEKVSDTPPLRGKRAQLLKK